ncbi:hypothetical protein RRG08_010810 [Elysia crispata]|uniref:Uncharacterized protein n=1 Tax=Elysia crispata TaxID=231223 RepID=A0AAE0ZF27_9GAST|nr:hypothetical protein RRG08_010810 [Elysia crispata]
MVLSKSKTELKLMSKVKNRPLPAAWRHSLASVELGSWAARGSRRGSSLPQLCASLSPLHASSRTEILQTKSRLNMDRQTDNGIKNVRWVEKIERVKLENATRISLYTRQADQKTIFSDNGRPPKIKIDDKSRVFMR